MIDEREIEAKLEASHIYDVWYGESQYGRQIEARIKANDIEDVCNWIRETYTAYDWEDTDIQSDETAYITINPCPMCDLNELDKPLEDNPCENCETSMYFQIEQLEEDTEENLILISPSAHTVPIDHMKHQAYHNITNPTTTP